MYVRVFQVGLNQEDAYVNKQRSRVMNPPMKNVFCVDSDNQNDESYLYCNLVTTVTQYK